eukprot:Protomagalhaensia_wolfi_Nauph_80__1165@NODE_1688_length_1397_cov_13_667158_g1311_i0_p1_GENE_NODE_1688_length_1397_cov_13_667158_g1311_i0NODE_1688_length_1397_cov_13_667158_g1311_i0_p1_ORF_typecomplete_len230_score19_99_NODE_1688_length_1397_cov_13_667158_g1311_i07081397
MGGKKMLSLCQCCVGRDPPNAGTEEVVQRVHLKPFHVDFHDEEDIGTTPPSSPQKDDGLLDLDADIVGIMPCRDYNRLLQRYNRDYWKNQVKLFVKRAIAGIPCHVYDHPEGAIISAVLRLDPDLKSFVVQDEKDRERIEHLTIQQITGMKYGTTDECSDEPELKARVQESILLYYRQSMLTASTESFSQELTNDKRGLFLLLSDHKERQRLFVSLFVLIQITKKKNPL